MTEVADLGHCLGCAAPLAREAELCRGCGLPVATSRRLDLLVLGDRLARAPAADGLVGPLLQNRAFGAFWIVVGAGLAAAALALGTPSALLAIPAATAAAAAMLYGLRRLRAGVVVHADGIILRGSLRDRHLAWREIRHFDVGTIHTWAANPAPALVVVLCSGGRLKADGVTAEGFVWNRQALTTRVALHAAALNRRLLAGGATPADAVL